MSWRKVTEEDLVAALAKSEVDAYRKSSTWTGDPVEPQIRATVAYVRGVIRSSPTKVKMNDDETTLPESLILPAMDYLRFSLLMRMNQPANESRTTAYQNAVDLFREIRAGKFTPESDDTTDASGEVSAAPAFGDATPSRLLD